MLDEAGEPSRIVVDESSFDFRDLDDNTLSDLLEDFADVLEVIQESHPVAASALWGAVECDSGLELCQFIYGSEHGVSPDVRRRFGRLLDKCRSWESSEELTNSLEIDGVPVGVARSVHHAVRSTAAGLSMACVGLARSARQGWLPVSCQDTGIAAEVYFLTAASELPQFWRSLYQRDDVPESQFFQLAESAFPKLVMASGLTFRKFEGTYAELRDWVVKALSVINDEFAAALTAGSGQSNVVQAALGRFGLDLSPESVKTHHNTKAMRQRDVRHDDETYRCEWHAKKDPTRNRIHFSLPAQSLGGRILIGIFIDHLPT